MRTYGIPRKIEQAVEVALTGEVRTIDLGRATFRAWDGSQSVSVSRTSRAQG